MKAVYKGKKVKVTKLILQKVKVITHPVIIQVKIEYKENGVICDEYVDPNLLIF